ncbi:uncharacterized protein ARMOST_14936 [Armillaria ostoyae]|uniref:Uncharacterized protein n=1 Tax=Armillaria ostoyae TaxID=47428 RepID=A0A284RRY7_ARMOS|nr:uncharacterized protein ARMOST_14936 [Armillaria ostoyae]
MLVSRRPMDGMQSSTARGPTNVSFGYERGAGVFLIARCSLLVGSPWITRRLPYDLLFRPALLFLYFLVRSRPP